MMESRPSPVLVVEDDRDIRETIAEILDEEGYPVAVSMNGAEALEFLRSDGAPRPRVILLDLMMPVMNGWEFHEELMKMPDAQTIPVVLLTGSVNSKEQADALGAAGVLDKPVSLAQLLDVVERFQQRPTSS